MASNSPLSDAFASVDALNAAPPTPLTPPPAPKPTAVQTTAPPPAPGAPPAGKPGLLASVVNSVKDTASKAMGAIEKDGGLAASQKVNASIGAAILRAPGQLMGGLADTAGDVGRFIGDNIDPKFIRGAINFGMQGSPAATLAAVATTGNRYAGASLADKLSARKSLGQVGYPQLNQLATEGAATALGSAALPAEGLAASMAKTAVSGGVAMSAQDLQQRGINAAIGAGADLGLTAMGAGGGALLRKVLPSKIVQATPVEAASDAIDRSFATARSAQAQDDAVAAQFSGKPLEPDPQEALDAGTRHSDPTTTDQDAGAPHPLAQDANAALDKAGAAERFPTDTAPPVDPEGKIVVAPASKDALDAANMGRGFTSIPAENESGADPIIFKEVADDGSQRVVGVTTPKDLDGFLQDAKHYSDAPETINTNSDHISGQWSLRPLGSADDVSAMGRAFADRLPEAAPVTHEETLAAAKEMGFDSPADAALLASQFSGQTEGLSSGMTAARLMSAKINEEMAGLRGTDWANMDPSDPAFTDALSKYHNGYSFMQSFRTAKSEVARALAANKIPLDGPIAKLQGIKPEDIIDPQPVPDFDTYVQNFGKVPPEDLTPYPAGSRPPLPRTPQEFSDMLDLHDLANRSGPDQLNAFWKGVTFHPSALKYLRTSLANFYTAGLVSRPLTFMRDLMGPAAMSILRTGERVMGTIPAAIHNMVLGDGASASDLLASAGDAPAAFMQTFGDIATSLKNAYDTTVSGHSRLQGAQPYNFNAHGIPQELIDAASGGNPLQAGMFTAGNLINKFPQAVHALHGGVNELAMRLSYLGTIRTQAMMYARQTGLEGDAFNDYVKQAVMASEDPLTGAATDVSALDQAQRTTMTKSVADPTLQPLMSNVMNTVSNIRENIPETKLILPIMTVPANAFGETLRRIPVLGQMFKGTQMELAGKMGLQAQAEAYGRILSGTGALTAGAILARQGLLTGAGPSHAQDRQVWTANGFQPYSMKVGGNWVNYARIDGLGPLLGIMAGFNDHTVYQPQDNPNLAFAAVSALAEYFKDQSNLKGLSDLLSFGGDPTQDPAHLARMTNGWASGFVPGFLQQIRNNVDPEKRVTMTPWDAIKNAIPGMSQTLDPQRNLFGDVTHVARYPLNILPLNTSDVNPQGPHSQSLAELQRLMTTTGYAPGVPPVGVPGGHFDQRQVKLEDGHSMYDALLRYRGLVTNEDGDHIGDALDKVMASDEYKNGFDGTPGGEAQTEDGQNNRGKMVAQVFDDFTKQARQQMASDSPTAARWLAVAKAKSYNGPGLNAHATGDLVKNPALLTSLGVNISDFEDKVKGNQ